MKTLILYGSRKGCTRKCAAMVKQQAGGGDVVDVQKAHAIDLRGYDRVVLGSSVWAGKVHPKARQFVEKNLPTLLTRRLALFICSGDEGADYLRENYPLRAGGSRRGEGSFRRGAAHRRFRPPHAVPACEESRCDAELQSAQAGRDLSILRGAAGRKRRSAEGRPCRRASRPEENIVKVLVIRMAVASVLLLLSAISGIIVRILGRPLSPAVLAMHKLVAVASLVLTIAAVYTQQKSVWTGAPALVLTIIIGLLFLLLFVSGALLISDKPAGVLLPAIHMAAPLLMVVPALLLYWLYRSTP